MQSTETEDLGYVSEVGTRPAEGDELVATSYEWESEYEFMEPVELIHALIETPAKFADNLEEMKARMVFILKSYQVYQDKDAERRNALGEIV